MPRIAVGIGGGAASTAITVLALILILMASSSSLAILTTTEEAFAASKSNNNNKDCKDFQFRTFESSSFYSMKAGNTITIGTSQDEYSL